MTLNKGFTLVELMVVISIIAIAFGVIVSSSASIQKSSRDTERQADLRQVQSALQQFYADQNFYPFQFNLVSDSDGKLTNSDGNPNTPTDTKVYLSKIPQDPSSLTTPYLYAALPANCDNQTSKCLQYCLYANLEVTDAVDDAQCSTIVGYNFELIQP